MEAMELTTSIGTLKIEAYARDWFIIEGPVTPEGKPEDWHPWPNVHFMLERCAGDRWKPTRDTLYYSEPGKKLQAPPPLVDELIKLGSEWANAHPEEFERAAKEEFDDHISYLVHDALGEIITQLREAQKGVNKTLRAAEFIIQGPSDLRRRVEEAAKMLRAMRLQAEAAVKAIGDSAGQMEVA